MVGGITKGTSKNMFKMPTTWIFLTFVVVMMITLQYRYTETKLIKQNDSLMYQIQNQRDNKRKTSQRKSINVLNQSIGPSYPQSTR